MNVSPDCIEAVAGRAMAKVVPLPTGRPHSTSAFYRAQTVRTDGNRSSNARYPSMPTSHTASNNSALIFHVTLKSRSASICMTNNFGAPADLHRTPARLGCTSSWGRNRATFLPNTKPAACHGRQTTTASAIIVQAC